MNPVLVERHAEGISGLRALLLGKHLRPRELALMVVAFVVDPQQCVDIINSMEVNDGEES